MTNVDITNTDRVLAKLFLLTFVSKYMEKNGFKKTKHNLKCSGRHLKLNNGNGLFTYFEWKSITNLYEKVGNEYLSLE